MTAVTNQVQGPIMSPYKYLYHIGKIALGALFVWSGVVKLLDPEVFGVIIDAFGIVPEEVIPALSYAIPVVEIGVGMALIFDLYGALSGTTLMLLFFMVILGYGIYLELDIDCGCFGPTDPEFKAFNSLRSAFYRDIGLMVLVGLLYFGRHRLGIKPRRLGQSNR